MTTATVQNPHRRPKSIKTAPTTIRPFAALRQAINPTPDCARVLRFGYGAEFVHNHAVPFADLALSKRLERAEGRACAEYAAARRHLCPESGAEWMECAGTYAVFDGIDSPVTQSFGLGIFEELSSGTLDIIERFFLDHSAPVLHEVSPLAGAAALNLIASRNYRPIEISNVLYRPLERSTPADDSRVHVHLIGAEERQLWTSIHARGWSHEHPELADFLLENGRISAARQPNLCFLAEIQGTPGAAAVLCIHEGVALLAGSATVPELRRHGLHRALVEERMRYAFDHGCDLAMMVAEPGSDSQRNAERKGFRVAYTRTKWRLAS